MGKLFRVYCYLISFNSILMDFLRRTGFCLMVIFSVSIFTACIGEKGEDKRLEAVFPKESGFVFVINGAQEAEVKQFKKLLNSLPKVGLWAKIEESYDKEMPEGPKYEKLLKPIIEGQWKIGVALSEVAVLSEVQEDVADPELNIAGKFSEADKVEELINILLERAAWADLTTDEKGGVKYWTAPSQEFYMFKYGDFFVVTMNEGDRDAALKRLEEGGGLDENEEVLNGVEKLEKENLGYFYGSAEAMQNVYKGLYTEMMPDLDPKDISIGATYLVVFAEDDGLVMKSEGSVPEQNEITRQLLGDLDYEVGLMDEVNGDGMIFYTEQSNLGFYGDAFMQGLTAGLQGVNPADFSSGISYVKQLATELGIAEESMMGILNSPFAVAISDIGTLYPTMSAYLKIDEDYVEDARALTIALDKWADQVIQEYDALMEAEGFGVGALKKEVELVAGGGLHKLYFDLSALPPDILAAAAFMPDLNLAALKLELYYGITGDNLFVVSFYPEFDEAFGKNAFAESDGYKKVEGDVLKDGYSLSYFSSQPLVDLMDRWIAIAESGTLVSPSDKADYEMYVKGVVGAVKYAVSSAKYEEGILKGEGYMWMK